MANTSSASSRLIHGGLRYLEYYEFRLVREALRERERLLQAAPHLIRPLEFVVPQSGSQRPSWMVRAGLFLYDWLASSSMPRSRRLNAKDRLLRLALKTADSGFVYWDAWTDDARLTLANALDAAELGAEVWTRAGLVSAQREGAQWEVALDTGQSVRARALVNAAGPWVSELLNRIGVTTKSKVRLVKGSHIMVGRMYHGRHAYLLQQPDRRVVFALNYDSDFTTIGTTDSPVDHPGDAAIARPVPFAQRIAALEQRIVQPGSMGMTPGIGGRRVVADQPLDLLPIRPCGASRCPLLQESVLRRHLPFETALGLHRPVLLAPQSPHFRHPQSSSPSKTPD